MTPSVQSPAFAPTGDSAQVDGARVEALTMQGDVVALRPVRADDAVALTSLHERASGRSRYLRFFSGAPSVEAEVRRLLQPLGDDHDCLVAETGGRLIGVAAYERIDQSRAECSVFVADDWHGQGIGTLLLENLRARARRAGYGALVATVLAANRPMVDVVAHLPAAAAWDREEPGTVTVTIPTRPDDATMAAATERDRLAERHSLSALLTPRSVAVVGAGRDPAGVGHQVLLGLIEQGFAGPVYAVNHHADRVAGQPCYPDLATIGRPVDLAVIAVPAESVAEVVEQCGAAGVRAAIVLGAGFGESAGGGARRQVAIVHIARRHGVRLVGPNCLGVINTDPAVRLAATFARCVPPDGPLAIASQSGAVGIALLDAVAAAGLGISSFVSLGDKADVSTNDLLAVWYDDPRTHLVALYVESFGNPRRFSWLARTLARRKPLLAVKSGRSSGGHRAGASHTGAAVVDDVWIDALFRQAGVIRLDGPGELLDVSRVLAGHPLPAGRRVGIIGNAGGLNLLCADAASTTGLQVVELSDGLQAVLAGASAHPAGTTNPVDLGADATAAAVADAIGALGHSAEVDAVVVTYVATRVSPADAVLTAIGSALDRLPSLPVAAIVVGAEAPPQLGERRAPVFSWPEPAIRALGRAADYAAWRREPRGRRVELSGIDRPAARQLVGRALAAGPGWQPLTVALDLLAAYGVPIVPTRYADDASSVVAAADALGYPVVVKAALPDLLHKTDLGAVILAVDSAERAAEAYRSVARALRMDSPPVLVQQAVSPGVEVAAGVVHHPVFGSLVTLGAGGVTGDLWQDHAFRLLPLTDVDARAMWRGLRVAPLLTGYRGATAGDTGALEQLLQRLGRLAEDLPEVAELDLNPVIVGPAGAVVVDVKLRLRAATGEVEADTHALERPARPVSVETRAADPAPAGAAGAAAASPDRS